jgi:hypothetical protein
MKRRRTLRVSLITAALGIMVAIAAIGQQKPASKLLLLDWASKSQEKAPPVAILVEMGLKDAQPKNWSGNATFTRAKVVSRDGYRFRDGDKLTGNGWDASSHKPMRGAGAMPKGVQILMEPTATIGVVYHLSDVQPDAAISLSFKEQEIDNVNVPLKEVLAGKTALVADGRAAVRLISTASVVYTGPTEDDFPAACYGPDGTLWLAWIAYHVKEDDRRVEAPNLKEQPKDFKGFFDPTFGDQLLVKYFRNGKWSDPFSVTGKSEDLMRCAIAAEGDGTIWVTYSANRQGKFNLYATPIKPMHKPDDKDNPTPKVGVEQLVMDGATPALSPVLSTDQAGNVHGAFQYWHNSGDTTIELIRCEKGKCSVVPIKAPEARRDEKTNPVRWWHPTIAASPGGGFAYGYDTYERDGDYDVALATKNGNRTTHSTVAGSSHYEARPSICYDTKDRLWIAYEEGPEQWGKNYGPLDERGNPMYFARTIKVVCQENGKLMKPVAELPPLAEKVPAPDSGQKVEALPRLAYPKIGIDGKGRIWLTYRVKFGTRYTTHPGSYWLTFARRLDGDKWSEPIELHHSDGLLDSRPVMLPHPAGGLRVIHNTDNRYTIPDHINNDLYTSYLDLPGDPVEPKLVPHDSGKKNDKLVAEAKAEAEAVKKIREHRLEAGGKKYQLLRGEFHRHTEISWDGGPDGSLEDMWRYGIDVAAMDWIGNGDHDNGAGREYTWWLTQKTTDAYHVANRFTPMFTYERSVSYPHGHRNCMFAQRGVRTLPRLAEADPKKRVAGIHADDTKMLYRYLKEFNGITASHTSATSMGTDWRDNDPVVEPIVEIYQGDRMSYEKQEAPRAGYDPKGDKKPFNIAGWYPDGFIDKAFAKGYKLGFQSSSDHTSTHISYCIVIAEKHDRAGILEAMKKRHVYAATDNIILDVKSGDHIQGDEFKSAAPPSLEIKVVGTAKLTKVEILKDSEVVHTFEPGQPGFIGKWTDAKPTPGVHYYYVRVQQADTELAWGSPMWIDFSK